MCSCTCFWHLGGKGSWKSVSLQPGPDWSAERVPGQPGLYSEALSQTGVKIHICTYTESWRLTVSCFLFCCCDKITPMATSGQQDWLVHNWGLQSSVSRGREDTAAGAYGSGHMTATVKDGRLLSALLSFPSRVGSSGSSLGMLPPRVGGSSHLG